MPKHDDLQLLGPFRTTAQEYELEQAAQRQIAKRPEQEQLLGNQRHGAADSTDESRAADAELGLRTPQGGFCPGFVP
jgi:hypothetical protein